MRKGLGLNRGRGYYNLVPQDHIVHSLSAKGVKTNYKDREVVKQACGYVFKDNKCPKCGAMFNQLHSHYLMCPKCEDKKEKAIGLAKLSGDFWAKGDKPDFKRYDVYRLRRFSENADDEERGSHQVGKEEFFVVPEDEADDFGEYMANEYGSQDYNNKIDLDELAKNVTGEDLKEICKTYKSKKRKQEPKEEPKGKRACKFCGQVHLHCPFTDCHDPSEPLPDDLQEAYKKKFDAKGHKQKLYRVSVGGWALADEYEVYAHNKQEAIKEVDKKTKGELTNHLEAGGDVEIHPVTQKTWQKSIPKKIIPPVKKEDEVVGFEPKEKEYYYYKNLNGKWTKEFSKRFKKTTIGLGEGIKSTIKKGSHLKAKGMRSVLGISLSEKQYRKAFTFANKNARQWNLADDEWKKLKILEIKRIW